MRYSLGFLNIAGAILCIASAIPARADLTGKEVVERCRKAYSGVRSYKSVETKTITIIGPTGKGEPAFSHSVVQFVRPGRLCIDGKGVDGTPFAFRSDGKNAWQHDSTASGWQTVESKRMFNLHVGTPIVELLTNAKSSAFSSETRFAGKAVKEKIDKHMAYRVDAANRMGKWVYWVDVKSYLLLRVQSIMQIQHLPGGGIKVPADDKVKNEDPSQREYFDIVTEFTDVKINGAIPESTFAKPAGAP